MTNKTASKTYPPCTPHSVAFLGLGVMGYPMAGHLVAAGHSVTVYNRHAAKAKDFQQRFGDGGKVQTVTTPAEAAQNANIVFACVGNDDDLRAVVLGHPGDDGTRADDGALAAMQSDAILVDHTTASAEVARELDALARTRGVHFIDAPISGGEAGAQNGVLTVMCGGDADVFSRVQPVAMAYAQAMTLLGPVGSGQLTKMVNQICIAGLVQGLSEAIAFGQKAGLDLEQVLDVIGKGAAQSWQMDNRGQTMAADQFDFGFAVDWMRKDLALVLAEAGRNGTSLPVTALVDQFYADIQRMGGGRWDTSSLIRRLTQPTLDKAG